MINHTNRIDLQQGSW